MIRSFIALLKLEKRQLIKKLRYEIIGANERFFNTVCSHINP